MGWNYKVTKRRKVVEERECVNVTCDLCDKEIPLEPFWHWPYRACEVSLGSRKEGYTHDTYYELLALIGVLVSSVNGATPSSKSNTLIWCSSTLSVSPARPGFVRCVKGKTSSATPRYLRTSDIFHNSRAIQSNHGLE